MSKCGKQTWTFSRNPPHIKATGTSAGVSESEGPLGELFDVRHADDRFECDTWEHAEQEMAKEAATTALKKAGVQDSDLDLIVGADLNAQLSGFYFGTRSFSAPALGVYSACASICESLAVASLSIDSGVASRVLVGTSSHNSTAERQFRYPTEYGIQKPPTAQRTVTGAAYAVLEHTPSTADPIQLVISAATIGRVMDMGVKSPWEMGAAMAPAAADTIAAHFRDTGTSFADFDCVATGDLGHIGHEILKELLEQRGMTVPHHLTDCGMLIYRSDQPEVFSGGSGGACCSLVTFAHLCHQLRQGTWKKILVSATGALLSAITAQQGDSIPCISHAVVIERKDGSN